MGEDRIKKIYHTNLKTEAIKSNMGWCNDPKSKFYNHKIKIAKGIKHEKLFRKDHKYNCLLVINYNIKKTVAYKGSAIFLHLTKDYKSTAGCIAIKEKDFNIMLKLINNKTKIKIS